MKNEEAPPKAATGCLNLRPANQSQSKLTFAANKK